MERYHVFKLGLAILFYAAYCIRPMLVSGLRSSSLVTNQTFRPEDYNVFYQGVDGTPGVDFPALSFIPRTVFSCDGMESGYYADLDTDCQVFHICEEGKKISFLCPNGTIFEQADLICEWWYKVDCANAPNLYHESAEFLRQDLARRKASRKVPLTGQERNHGAVMRIEESASVSAQQNGKPFRVSTSRLLGQSESSGRPSGVSSRVTNNLIQSAIDKDVQNLPQKRYNDDDTANFVNNVYEGTSRVPTFVPSSSSIEKQVYTRSTTPSTLGGFASNLGEIPSRKQLNRNRGSIKFSSAFGSKIIDSPGSTLKPSADEYDLEFPKHKSETTRGDFRPRPSSGSNTVKIDSSKVNLGQPKQKSTVALTRNEILNRRLEPVDSDELQIPQETASFSSNSFNSLQSGGRKYSTGSTAHPNHRPTYSDLKRPDFSSTKLVNAINSVTPQYITTQSINSGKPFIGSTVGASIFNRNTGRTQQNEETVRPFSSTETSVPYTVQVSGVSDDFSTFGVRNQGLSSTPQPSFAGTQETDGLSFTTVKSQYGTGEADGSSNLQLLDGDTQVPSSTPQQGGEGIGTVSTTEGYRVQSGVSYTSSQPYEGLPSTSQPVFVGTQDEEAFGQSSTTERSVPSTIPPVPSTYQSFEDNSQDFSSTAQPGLSSTFSPSLDSKTTRTVDHATVYGTFSRATTATPPSGGVEVKLGKNVDKVSIQLSKSLGGRPPKDNTVGPQLASDGYVRITAGLSQPIRGDGSQSNLGPGPVRGGSQTQGGVVSSISSFISGTPAIGAVGNGAVGSTVAPNIVKLAGGASITPAIPVSIVNDGILGETQEIGGSNIQSTTSGTNLIGTGPGVAEGVGSTGRPLLDVTISQNNFPSTSSGGIAIGTGGTTSGFIDENTGRDSSVGITTSVFGGAGSTIAPDVQASTGFSVPPSQTVYGTVKPVPDATGSTLRPNVQGSIAGGFPNLVPTDTGSVPTSDSSSSVGGGNEENKLAAGGTGFPNIVPTGSTGSTGESSDGRYETTLSSVGPNVIINQNTNAAAPSIKDSFGLSTVRPQVGTGTRSQVTDLLPIPEVTSGSVKETNGTRTRQNSFRPNFYPTRSRGPSRGSKPSSTTDVRGSTRDTSYQTTPVSTIVSGTSGIVSTLNPDTVEINFSQNDIGSTLPPAEELSTFKPESVQSGDSSAFRNIPSIVSSFGQRPGGADDSSLFEQGQGGAGDSNTFRNIPTTASPLGQVQDQGGVGDSSAFRNIPSSASSFGQGQRQGGIDDSNSFRNVPTTASPFGQGQRGGGDSNAFRNIPTTASTFEQGPGGAGTSSTFRNVPTTVSSFAQGQGGGGDATAFRNIPTTASSFGQGQGQGGGGDSNGFRNIPTTAGSFGQGQGQGQGGGGDSNAFRNISTTGSPFGPGQGDAGDSSVFRNIPTTTSPFGQGRGSAGDSNDFRNAPTTASPLGQVQGGGESNAFGNIPTTARTFGQGQGDAVTGTGFYVTRGSAYGSTTPSPFGLSGRTTSSSDLGPTPSVNVSPNSEQGTAVSSDATSSSNTGDSLAKSETRYPRPFQKSPNAIDDGSSTKIDSVTPTYFTYKISSARPFELPKDRATPSPTIPTPFTTARSVQENVDNMINALKEIVGSQDYSSETPRPGLVVPPSAGPQTLHTLAQYFANALDGIVAEREKETGEELDDESKEKLTSLLTQMTMYRYKELFKGSGPSGEDGEETTTIATDESDELHGDDSNNFVETPQLRQLARNFSLALSSYLNDPDAFRKELETFRPTEPTPQGEENTEVGLGEEELLNFSDADSKSSFSPLFPTPQSPSPTWGFILATKPSESLDVKNSLNPDLHTADTQSFVPGFNNLATNTGKGISRDRFGSKADLPGDHWTISPGVTKLWQSALSINPAVLNENLDTTRPFSQTTEPYVAATTPAPAVDFPQSEIQYDLRSLPKLSLNSTQVHGILIDFVNTTKTDEANRLQRLLKKLNTTEDEFLHRMKEIESNPLTKRLILLLISECGANVTKDLEKDPLQGLSEILDSSSTSAVTNHDGHRTVNSDIPELVDPNLQQDEQDTRALQLLNSLYAIASKFGK